MSSVISKLETTEMFLHTGMDKVQCNNFLKYVTFKKKKKKNICYLQNNSETMQKCASMFIIQHVIL